jgi:hypothetical protein
LPKSARLPRALPKALLAGFDTRDRIPPYLAENLLPEAGPPGSRGRTVAACAAPVHRVRLMGLKAPEQRRQALAPMLKAAVEGYRQVLGFRPDVAGLPCLTARGDHRRGQIRMPARQLGLALSEKVVFCRWEWGSRGKD